MSELMIHSYKGLILMVFTPELPFVNGFAQMNSNAWPCSLPTCKLDWVALYTRAFAAVRFRVVKSDAVYNGCHSSLRVSAQMNKVATNE